MHYHGASLRAAAQLARPMVPEVQRPTLSAPTHPPARGPRQRAPGPSIHLHPQAGADDLRPQHPPERLPTARDTTATAQPREG